MEEDEKEWLAISRQKEFLIIIKSLSFVARAVVENDRVRE